MQTYFLLLIYNCFVTQVGGFYNWSVCNVFGMAERIYLSIKGLYMCFKVSFCKV